MWAPGPDPMSRLRRGEHVDPRRSAWHPALFPRESGFCDQSQTRCHTLNPLGTGLAEQGDSSIRSENPICLKQLRKCLKILTRPLAYDHQRLGSLLDPQEPTRPIPEHRRIALTLAPRRGTTQMEGAVRDSGQCCSHLWLSQKTHPAGMSGRPIPGRPPWHRSSGDQAQGYSAQVPGSHVANPDANGLTIRQSQFRNRIPFTVATRTAPGRPPSSRRAFPPSEMMNAAGVK